MTYKCEMCGDMFHEDDMETELVCKDCYDEADDFLADDVSVLETAGYDGSGWLH